MAPKHTAILEGITYAFVAIGVVLALGILVPGALNQVQASSAATAIPTSLGPAPTVTASVTDVPPISVATGSPVWHPTSTAGPTATPGEYNEEGGS